jgi:hypothetical protein
MTVPRPVLTWSEAGAGSEHFVDADAVEELRTGTSISTAVIRTPRSFSASASAATAGALRPVVARMPAYPMWPASARARAVRFPKPLDAPVIASTFGRTLTPCPRWPAGPGR